jgi:diguanylate cyclase (GGDEF)-like protein
MRSDAESAGELDPQLEIQNLQRRNAELELLYESIRDLTSTLSVHQVLERLMERTLLHLNAEIGSILLLHPDSRLRIVVSRGLPCEVVKETAIEVGDGISGHVARYGEALLVKDIERDDRFRRRNHERYYTNSFISAPLVHQRSVRGVVNINNKRSRRCFRTPDLRLLEAIAGHAAVALANARQYEELLERAQRDALTGLADHGQFWSELEVEHARALRHHHPLAVVMFDIDHFKGVNDRLGHPMGDLALGVVARRLEQSSRAHDTVARYGGDEFAVILPETDLAGARTFAEKIGRVVSAHRFGPEDRQQITVSAGVAAVEVGGEPISARRLVEVADARLYGAKRSGRNSVCSDGGTGGDGLASKQSDRIQTPGARESSPPRPAGDGPR